MGNAHAWKEEPHRRWQWRGEPMPLRVETLPPRYRLLSRAAGRTRHALPLVCHAQILGLRKPTCQAPSGHMPTEKEPARDPEIDSDRVSSSCFQLLTFIHTDNFRLLPQGQGSLPATGQTGNPASHSPHGKVVAGFQDISRGRLAVSRRASLSNTHGSGGQCWRWTRS